MGWYPGIGDLETGTMMIDDWAKDDDAGLKVAGGAETGGIPGLGKKLDELAEKAFAIRLG